MTLPLIVWDAISLLVLGAGVYALYRLDWLDRFHHLWFVFAAFGFGPATTLALVVRTIALIVALDDAIQHVLQWSEWCRLHAGQTVWPPVPDEGTGWPGIYRSPLHQLYWWVASKI